MQLLSGVWPKPWQMCQCVNCWAGLTLPCSAGYIQHSPDPLLFQQRHHPAFVLLRPTLRVSDVQLPDFRCFAVGILIRKTLSGHPEGSGPKHAVDRHTAATAATAAAAACTCRTVFSQLYKQTGKVLLHLSGRYRPRMLTPNIACYYLYARGSGRNFNPITPCRGLTPTFWLDEATGRPRMRLYVTIRPGAFREGYFTQIFFFQADSLVFLRWAEESINETVIPII